MSSESGIFEPSKPDQDRPRGMLTNKDRRYLRNGEVPETRQGKYERKKNARQRITNGIVDFQDARLLPDDERTKIFNDMEYGDELYSGLAAMVSFAMVAAQETGLDEEELIADAAELASYTPHPEPTPMTGKTGRKAVLADVTVDINRSWRRMVSPLSILDRLEEGDEISDTEIGILLRSGLVDQTDNWDLLQERFSADIE